jgi:D-alanyl-D-alanine carboxypeptidase (penicillin-binding protein 5/6)
VEGSSIYLKHGEELTVLDLLYGLLLESGNDAAVALALHISGSVDDFAVLMNDYAESVGCKNSHFKNPHGLDQEGHYSTARDLSLIAAEAMRNKLFCDIVSTKQISIAGRYFKNHNKLLWNCPGAVGIKTGYTESAGRSLVSCAERDGMRLICVTLSAPNDWNDHTSLYNWGFKNYSCINIAIEDNKYGYIPVISGEKEKVSIHPAEDFNYLYQHSDRTELSWEIPKFVYAPAVLNEVAGMIIVKKNGETIKEIPLVYGDTVKLDQSVPLTFLEKLKWSILYKKQPVIHYGHCQD